MGHTRQMELSLLEIEATLIICSENPQVVAGQIANLTSIADYQRLPHDYETIHHLYFGQV